MKKCQRCDKKILPDQKGVMQRDFIGNKTIDSRYWHFQCFLDWLSEKVEEKALNVYTKTMGDIMPEFKVLTNKLVNNAIQNSQNNLQR